ncbi:MAG: hypothetical protein A3G24_09160 [Betaproteobacteria bacterium RIFCSPLOWO2_12_FULL_62_13]|nr:MAG: hypothetical protein A3G24_09160 [Betaproteobacteria bacterium RIFCSPLOWO2_12_FULL_62_13]
MSVKYLKLKLLGPALLLAFWAAAAVAGIWYEDNSFARRGGLPEDFVYKFQQPESWKAARGGLDVYQFRVNMFNRNYPQITDEFLTKHMIPVLKDGRIKVALDTAGPLLSGCKNRARRIDVEFEWISRIKRAGLDVHYVSLQSLLSKPYREGRNVLDCPIAERVKGGIAYAEKFAAVYPNAEFGLIDALPSKGQPYKEAYKYTRDMFQSRNIPLKYIHLDLSIEMVWNGNNGLSWKKVIEVEEYVKKLGLKFGLLFTSRQSGQISDEAFYKTIVSGLEDYRRAGGAADHYIIISWFPYPRQTVRRVGEVAGGYPVTDAILEFSRRIESPARVEEMPVRQQQRRGGG